MPADDELAEAARAFLRAAWNVLEQQHVVPTPAYHPLIEVGRDYFGPDVAGSECDRLEQAIAKLHPRFGDDMALGERDFPGAYVYSFLQAFVARTAVGSAPFSTTGDAAEQSIDDLRTAVHADTTEVACCRVVSHMTTTNSDDVEAAGIRIVPLGFGSATREALDGIRPVIWGAASAFGREDPWFYDPPASVLIARMDADDPYDAGGILSGRIERLLLVARLLWAATTQSGFELQGETAPVRRFSPRLVEFRGAGTGLLSPTNMVRRTTRIAPEDGRRIEGLSAAIDALDRLDDGMVMAPFAVAMINFQRSYHAYTWYEQLVSLATAFEAALSGSDTADVTLRLKSRAAALLATEDDPAPAIFNDVGELYHLRSRLVHGGALRESELKKRIRRLSTGISDRMLGLATGYAVDRMRELVRRSLLARIFLASGDHPLWPLANDKGVDAALSDDETRAHWRSQWRDGLESIDALFAANRPRPAVDQISQDDR